MCLHFHIKDAGDPPLMWPYYLFHCCPLIGFFSRASISRDPFYDMLATRKRRIANKKWRGTIFSASTASIFLSFSSWTHKPHTAKWWLSTPRKYFAPEDEPQFMPWTVYKSCALAGETSHTTEGTAELQETQICGFLLGAGTQTTKPASFSISHTPPTSPSHGHNLFLGLPKAQLPCFRCTCMHVGYYRPIFLCLCVCVYAAVCML